MTQSVVEVMLEEGRWTIRHGAVAIGMFENQPAAVAFAQAFVENQDPAGAPLRIIVHFPPGWCQRDESR